MPPQPEMLLIWEEIVIASLLQLTVKLGEYGLTMPSIFLKILRFITKIILEMLIPERMVWPWYLSGHLMLWLAIRVVK